MDSLNPDPGPDPDPTSNFNDQNLTKISKVEIENIKN